MLKRSILSGNLIFALVFILLQSCTSGNKQVELDKLSWLTGRWENIIEGKQTIEIWERQDENGYLVQGLMLEGADTIFSETIKVTLQNQKISYQVNIPEQNNGQVIGFTLTQNDGNKAVFINPGHDFPQKISYTRKGEKEVEIQLEGTVKGNPIKENYTLKKQTAPVL